MVIDQRRTASGARRRRRRLSAAGRSIRSPCATVFDVTRRYPTCRSSASAASPTGGTRSELMLAGAAAIQVGTATFAEPQAAVRVAARDGQRGRRQHGVADRSPIGPDRWAAAGRHLSECTPDDAIAWSRTMVSPMATPPQLTPEQRTAALAKAAEARDRPRRAEEPARSSVRSRSPKPWPRPTRPSASSRSSRCSSRSRASARSRRARSWKTSASPTTAGCRASAQQQKAVTARPTRQVSR